jgi:hypothetical protein
MTCDGCNRKAKFMLYEQLSPHCESCYHEALDGCTVPILVMTYEAYEYAQRKEVVKSGQAPIARTA